MATLTRLFTRRYCVGARQTLAVRDRINEKKRAALLGGGERRIEAQHKKVRSTFS